MRRVNSKGVQEPCRRATTVAAIEQTTSPGLLDETVIPAKPSPARRCMLMYAEHRRSSGDKPCCPLCRVDWSLAAVRALRENSRRQAQENGGGKRRGGAAAANSATSARAPAVAPVTCRSCSIKVQAAFFRCLVCTPPGSWVSQGQASWVALGTCEISFVWRHAPRAARGSAAQSRRSNANASLAAARAVAVPALPPLYVRLILVAVHTRSINATGPM